MYKFVTKKGETKKCFIIRDMFNAEMGDYVYLVEDESGKKHKCIQNEDMQLVEIGRK